MKRDRRQYYRDYYAANRACVRARQRRYWAANRHRIGAKQRAKWVPRSQRPGYLPKRRKGMTPRQYRYARKLREVLGVPREASLEAARHV